MIKVDDIESNSPIMLQDNVMGIVIRFCENEIGVQVPGEEEIRWLPLEHVIDLGGGALCYRKGKKAGDK